MTDEQPESKARPYISPRHHRLLTLIADQERRKLSAQLEILIEDAAATRGLTVDEPASVAD